MSSLDNSKQVSNHFCFGLIQLLFWAASEFQQFRTNLNNFAFDYIWAQLFSDQLKHCFDEAIGGAIQFRTNRNTFEHVQNIFVGLNLRPTIPNELTHRVTSMAIQFAANANREIVRSPNSKSVGLVGWLCLLFIVFAVFTFLLIWCYNVPGGGCT